MPALKQYAQRPTVSYLVYAVLAAPIVTIMVPLIALGGETLHPSLPTPCLLLWRHMVVKAALPCHMSSLKLRQEIMAASHSRVSSFRSSASMGEHRSNCIINLNCAGGKKKSSKGAVADRGTTTAASQRPGKGGAKAKKV